MESKDYSVQNTPIKTTQHISNVKNKKTSKEVVKTDSNSTLEKTKSLSSNISSFTKDPPEAIFSDLRSRSASKSDSELKASASVIGNQKLRQSADFDRKEQPDAGGYGAVSSSVNEVEVDSYTQIENQKQKNSSQSAVSSYSKDSYSKPEIKSQENLPASDSYSKVENKKEQRNTQALDSHSKVQEQRIVPKAKSKRMSPTERSQLALEKSQNEQMQNIFNLSASSLREGPNLINPDFKTPEKHALYADVAVKALSTAKEGVLVPLGKGANKTIFATAKVDTIFAETVRKKSFVVNSGSLDTNTLDAKKNEEAKFSKTDVILAAKINEMELKGALKTYGILFNEDNTEYMIITKKADMGTMRSLLSTIDDKKGLSLLLDAHANIKEFHDHNISHNDVKLSNFLIHKGKNENERILLNDYGTAIINSKPEAARKTNFLVLDPFRMRNQDKVNYESYAESDKYAYGLSIIEFLRRNSKDPIDTEPVLRKMQDKVAPWINYQMSDMQCEAFVDDLIENTPIPAEVPELKQLLQSMMAFDPKDRPSNLIIQERIAGIKAKLG